MPSLSFPSRAWGPVALLFWALPLLAQPASVSGLVSDAQGLPLPGANVVVAEGQGTIADAEGRYRLELPAGDHVLAFRFVGHEPRRRGTPRAGRAAGRKTPGPGHGRRFR
jgi:hypothetical protein